MKKLLTTELEIHIEDGIGLCEKLPTIYSTSESFLPHALDPWWSRLYTPCQFDSVWWSSSSQHQSTMHSPTSSWVTLTDSCYPATTVWQLPTNHIGNESRPDEHRYWDCKDHSHYNLLIKDSTSLSAPIQLWRPSPLSPTLNLRRRRGVIFLRVRDRNWHFWRNTRERYPWESPHSSRLHHILSTSYSKNEADYQRLP